MLPVAGALLAVGVVAALQVILRGATGPFPARGITATSSWAAYWLLATPVLVWLASRFPLHRGILVRSLVLQIGAGGLAAMGYAQVMEWLAAHWLRVLSTPQLSLEATWAMRFQFGLFSAGFILACSHAQNAFRQMREREVTAARLEGELAKAQLHALKAQLQPHFLFNTLHAVTVLIRRDAEAATRMLMQLSDLLRLVLSDGDRQEVTLAHELRFTQLYLEIERTRFRDRLRVSWDVEPGIERAAVPTLVLQPLVENALRHGIEPRATGGSVSIAAARSGEVLTLSVTDDGVGQRPRTTPRPGVGLAATQGRLARLYGGAYRLSIEDRPGGGTQVLLAIPYRLHATLETPHGPA